MKKYILPLFLVATILSSCTVETPPTPITPAFRQSMPYSAANDSVPFKALFVDQNGDTTVDLKEGHERVNMIKALDAYIKLPNPAGSTAVLDMNTLQNIFANTGSPFTGVYSNLNSSSYNLRNIVAKNYSDPTAVITTLDNHFATLVNTSTQVGEIASEGKAGKLGNYLVDEKGIEWAQIIAKSLIGALQLDHISNGLLGPNSLNADNSKLVTGKNYTALEHQWDMAFAHLTLNPVYMGLLAGNSSGETYLGAYVWEYNKSDFAAIHKAYVLGRIAIVNNDKAQMNQQADFIRNAMEKAIANAALGYLQKVKDNATDMPRRAHAYGEGLGFIYSLRFCQKMGATTAKSEQWMNQLHFNTTGIWQLTNNEVDQVITDIKAAYNL